MFVHYVATLNLYNMQWIPADTSKCKHYKWQRVSEILSPR